MFNMKQTTEIVYVNTFDNFKEEWIKQKYTKVTTIYLSKNLVPVGTRVSMVKEES